MSRHEGRIAPVDAKRRMTRLSLWPNSPLQIRGFGPVKQASESKAAKRREDPAGGESGQGARKRRARQNRAAEIGLLNRAAVTRLSMKPLARGQGQDP